MEVGDIVRPTLESKYFLRSGYNYYDNAVVISVTPFILTSLEADMKWQATIKKEYFEVVGKADVTILEHCKSRLVE